MMIFPRKSGQEKIEVHNTHFLIKIGKRVLCTHISELERKEKEGKKCK